MTGLPSMSMRLHSRQLSFIFYTMAALVAVAAFATMPWWTVDDAFISYRYGKNLLVSGELNWNPGEPRVEGYTGILLPLLAYFLLAIGIPLLDGIKVLGILAMLACLHWTWRTLRILDVAPALRALTTLLLAITPLIYLHSISGLETMFFMALLSRVFYGLCTPSLIRPLHFQVQTAIALLLCGLCRPEGLALAVWVVVVVFLQGLVSKAITIDNKVKVLFVGSLLGICGYWVWRYGYYGSWLPNSYYSKVFEGLLNPDAVFAWAKFMGYYIAIPTFGALILKGFPGRQLLKSLGLVGWVALSFGACCMLTYFHSHLWMNYGSRFFIPFLPIALVGLAAWVNQTLETPIAKWKRGVLAALMVVQFAVMALRFHQEWAFLRYYDSIVQEELIPAGQALHQMLPAGSRVISFMDAGAVGFYSALPIVDFGRLNDVYLAQSSPSQSQVIDYFYQQEAAAIVMTSEQSDSLVYIPEAMAIAEDSRFDAYEKVAVWGNSAKFPYWQFLYRRRP